MNKALNQDNSSPFKSIRYRGHEYLQWEIVVDNELVQVYTGNVNTPQKSDLIFVHGLASDWNVWEKQMHAFCKTYNVYSLELPWTGKSSMEFESIEQLALWFHRVLEMLPSCEGKRILITHSFGATVTAIALSLRSGRIDGAVFCSPFWKTSKTTGLVWKEFRTFIDNYEDVVRSLISHSSGRKTSKEVIDIMTDKVLELSKPVALIHFFEFLSVVPEADFSNLKIPCLVAIGDMDTVVNPQHAVFLKDALPNSRFSIMKGVGHFPMIEALKPFDDNLNLFLGEISNVE